MRIILIAISSLIVSLLISGCSSTAGYNPTVFPYKIDQEKINARQIKNVIVAPTALSIPAPSHLRTGDRKTKAMVRNYLQSKGYKVLPSYQFENAWKQASRTYGDVYDPSTGKINAKSWRAAMYTVGQKLRAETKADAIIFADVFEHDVSHGTGLQHQAKWYGVTRKPSLRGTGGVPQDFNWAENIKAASLSITIFDIDLNQIFNSRAGIETLEEIDLKKSTPAFARKKNIMKKSDLIEDAIELGFHPFVPMKKYPGKKPEE